VVAVAAERVMGPSEIAKAYADAHDAFRAAAQPRTRLLYRVIEGIAWASMAAAVVLSLMLVAQVLGIYSI
jgi:hypothetical protein